MNAVVILFICDLDEMFYDILMTTNPSWVKKITLQDDEEEEIPIGQEKDDEEIPPEAGSQENCQVLDVQGQPLSVQALSGEVQGLKDLVGTLQRTVKLVSKENAKLIQLLEVQQSQQSD